MEKQAGSEDSFGFCGQNLAELQKYLMLELILVPFQYSCIALF